MSLTEKVEWDDDGKGGAPGHPGCFSYKVDGNTVSWRHAPHGTDDDPTETWRAALGESTSAQLRRARAEAAGLRTQLEQALERHEVLARELADARFDNRRLRAELDSALRTLNQQTTELSAAYRDIEELTVKLGLETEARAGAVIALHAAEKQLLDERPNSTGSSGGTPDE